MVTTKPFAKPHREATSSPSTKPGGVGPNLRQVTARTYAASDITDGKDRAISPMMIMSVCVKATRVVGGIVERQMD
ncbi:MAG: hypothetical protein C4339_04550 [Nitrososphaerota archaeon]